MNCKQSFFALCRMEANFYYNFCCCKFSQNIHLEQLNASQWFGDYHSAFHSINDKGTNHIYLHSICCKPLFFALNAICFFLTKQNLCRKNKELKESDSTKTLNENLFIHSDTVITNKQQKETSRIANTIVAHSHSGIQGI